jgi:hypothetical protein
MEQSLNQIKVNQERLKGDKLYKCDNRFVDGGSDPDEAGYFVPVGVGAVSP